MSGTGATAPGPGTFDLDLAGRPLLRLIDPAGADVAAIQARLGLVARPVATPGAAGPPGTPEGEPPILTVRYVTGLDIDPELWTVGKDDGAFDARSFVVRAAGRPVAIVPFERIGQVGAEVIAVRGSGVPGRLVSLLNLALLGHDGLAIHASAVELEGTGIAACGWSGSGKTEAMLGLMHLGARFVGDEWTYLLDGRLVGLPESVRIQDWHAAQLPWLRARIGRAAAWRMRAAAGAQRGGQWLERTPRSLPGVRALGRASRRSASGRHVDVPVEALFDAPQRAASAALERIVLLETTSGPAIRVEAVEPAVVISRMALAHVHHRRELMGWYWQSRFAFPERRNALLDDIEAVERARLTTAFEGRPAIRVEHPHGVDIAALGRAIADASR